MSKKSLFKIVLVEPEIPQNTGNIGRTCVGTCCELHLVGHLGFEISDRTLKRAGLDYWQHLDWYRHNELEDCLKLVAPGERVFYFSTKAKKNIFEIKFQPGDWLIFGRETKGLPESLVQRNLDHAMKIPMPGKVRSLNLATAVAVVIYEGLRQSEIPSLSETVFS